MKNNLQNAQTFIYRILQEGAILGNYNAIYTEKKALFDIIVNEFQVKENISWRKEKDWSLKDIYPERYQKQKAMLEKNFIPHLNKQQKIGDLASANGEWSIFISEFAEQVDGYEYSANMVKTAKKKVKHMGIKNISFYQADARKLKFDRAYDNFMMLGLITYICEPTDVELIINNVANSIIGGGHLVTKDTLNTSGKDVLYLFNSLSGYQAAYYSQEKYYEFFNKAGFELENEELLDEVAQDGFTFISRGAVWIKK